MMAGRHRYTESRDANEPAIVEALVAVGASVQTLHGRSGRPDLLVGWRQENFLLEVKNPARKTGRGKLEALGIEAVNPLGEWADLGLLHGPGARTLLLTQARWHRGWQGQKPVIVETVDQALRAIGAI